MILKIQNSKITKGIAIFLLVSFLMEISRPVALFALTGGPSQPEMAGFTPVNTNEMVDLFSGDFHYTIPVMTVPGPNGGYPVNLNYNSGIGMEHDASWVGLGWNLNPGAITRQVRGIPDDFNGLLDNIKKTYKRRNNTTFVFSPGGGLEIAGANFGIGLNASQSLVYNTYSGISLSSNFGIAASYIRDRSIKDDKTVENAGYKALTVGGSINFDSDNGITPSFSMNGGTKNMSYGAKFGFNSKSGNYTFSNNFSANFSKDKKGSDNSTKKGSLEGGGFGVGTSFSTAACLPPVPIEMQRSSFGISAQVGGHASVVQGYGIAAANVSIEKTSADPVISPAYGFMYTENTIDNSLQDFNREKELAVNEHSLNLPLPVMTPDIYTITGESMAGTFRAYRSGIGYISDRKISTTDNTLNTGADFSFGYGFQVGVSLSDNVSKSVSGPWSADYSESLLKYKSPYEYGNSSNKSIHPVLYEPFYFKMSSEQTGANPNYLDYIGGEKAVAYTLKERFSFPFGICQAEYCLNDELKDNNGKLTSISRTVQPERNKRTQLIEYKTVSEKGERAEKGRQLHHIAEISVVNANGERYTYGKALYNNAEKEVSFSIPPQDVTTALNNSTTENYDLGHASGIVRVGKEKLYSCIETNPYAYTYLITSVTSPDYVDITGNGPSEDDLGYWVKFAYNDVCSDYKWRFPYKGANLSIGNPSNANDDIGSYNYGTKEIKYVDIIETKTHFAKFHTSVREDAAEVANDYKGGRGSRRLHQLDSIQLFCKSDRVHPIKTAVFHYSYTLCKNNPSHIDNKGKLTLDSICFKYGNSERMSSYKFAYNGKYNYNYNPVKMDRWGNYKGNASYFEHYVSQDTSSADAWAQAWCLSKIELPSGGSIEVEYESDDYAYVQDKQAMQMVELHSTTSFNKENGAYYVYFRKKPGFSASSYVSGFKNNLMFFKIAFAVKQGASAYDYVQGYVKIKPETAVDANLEKTVGKVEVVPFEAYNKVHPIYFLCCQNLRKCRPDVLFNMDQAEDNNSSDAIAFFKALVSDGMVGKAKSVYDNNKFYNFCLDKKYYKGIITNDSLTKSYLRLNVPDKIKYGGGHRVKRITMHDHWEKSEAGAYKQEYFYRTLENGKLISSGVAEYEPQVCGEETALRYPVYDEVQGFFFKEDEVYSEEPYGESYFPAATVGYSKVVVKTFVPDHVNLAASGIQVHEFYTAKDFPITVSQTVLKKYQNALPNLIKILTGGFKQVAASAFSQGYQIELNDMHGKTKRMATYPYQYTDPAKEKDLYDRLAEMFPMMDIAYYYKTQNGKLDNRVEVLTGDNKTETQILGQTYDFTTDLRESYSNSKGFGLSGNFGMPSLPWPSFYVTVFPSFDSFEETVRSVATTKVIYNTGILEKTVASNNKSIITTRNLQWDPYTGQPLLTTVTNDFEQPVYNYSMPAYWSYPNLAAASDNYRAYYKNGWTYDTLTNAFDRYDYVSMAGTDIRTIESIVKQNTTPLRIKGWSVAGNLDNNYLTPNFVQVLVSRKSNQLSAVAASTVSLTNPLSERRFPLFDAFNNTSGPKLCFEYTDCDGRVHCARVVYHNKRLYFLKVLDCSGKDCLYAYGVCSKEKLDPRVFTECAKDIVSSPDISLPDTTNLFLYTFKRTGDVVKIYRRSNGQLITSFPWKDPKNIFRECLDDVLQASAVEFSPAWQYDYADAGISSVTSGSGKESYLRIPNRYRSLRSNPFVVDRKQEGHHPEYQTNAAHDGTFDYFAFFNHATGNGENLQNPWTWAAEITKYSPFNFEIENKNALGIYSSALYGYSNSLATAVANNARYYEMGFDGFENDLPFSTARPRGHLKYNNGEIKSDQSHSGNSSLFTGTLSISVATIPAGNATPTGGTLTLVRGKQYVFSCWVRRYANAYNPGGPGSSYMITINNGTPLPLKVEGLIEEWQRVEVVFTAPASAEMTLNMKLAGNIQCHYDDIRIMPFNGTMKSYVYNPANFRLIAELDENNYATFYNYDEEGVLVQIKKETEKGIRTIQTTRQHLKGN